MYGINKNLKLHFIGIGGIGMSGIAKVLMNLGYAVSGSDLGENETVLKLKSRGAIIYKGHSKENVKDAEIIVYSSAIDEKNPEIVEAKLKKIPMIKRAEMLAELMRLKYGMAVAGSHGKTTTTSFLATIMNGLKLNPTYIVGGLVKNLEDNAGVGDGDLIIAEADESDGSFLYLNPIMSVITNIDNDHLDHYGTIENLQSAFKEFSNKVPFHGIVALNANDEPSIDLLKNLKRPYRIFGIPEIKCFVDEIDYKATDIKETARGSSFNVSYENENVLFNISLSGNHNVLNALGAIVLAHSYGAKLEDIAKCIIDFEGVSRRQEKIYTKKDFLIIDDYAHHPTEIVVTIETIKKRYSDKKVVVCFEPHRFSRTKRFWNEFVSSFNCVDELFIAPIYAASEDPVPYIDSEVLAKSIKATGIEANYIDSTRKIGETFRKYRDTNTVILTLGAGAISRIAKEIINDEFK
jgi:UDP-N-acetylmuramate--alanine ligase